VLHAAQSIARTAEVRGLDWGQTNSCDLATPMGVLMPEQHTGFKIGENGVEGKCSLCGTYVIKGGIRFREKSVLCSECAAKQAKIGNPYQAEAGRR